VSPIKYLVRQPSLWITLVLWCMLSAAAIIFCRNGVPLDRPELAGIPPITDVFNNSIGLFIIILLVGIVAFLARHRPLPNLAERAPERGIALRETLAMWIYGVVVLFVGRIIATALFQRRARAASQRLPFRRNARPVTGLGLHLGRVQRYLPRTSSVSHLSMAWLLALGA
jgi:uncharacterized membrane protein YidH (DUF202 family)